MTRPDVELPWSWARRERQVVLLCVRHGQTEWNATGRFLGKTDVPLNETGRAQAARLAVGLPGPLHAVYASPLSRALETAKAVHRSPTIIDAFAELDQGQLEGLSAPQAIARFPDFFEAWGRQPGHAPVPGGETLAALQDRVVTAARRVAQAHEPGQVIGVFSHQMAISSLTCAVLGEPLTRWRAHRVGNTQATALAWSGQRFEVVVQRAAFSAEERDA